MVSIIIPIYNTEKYLDKCIESVVYQTYKNIEIILVDDGSTDGSGKRCDEWALQDARIKVYHKANGGLMCAWKYGLLKASGDYISFVDSDDWIDLNTYELVLSHQETKDADLIMFGFVRDGNGVKVKKVPVPNSIYDRQDIILNIYPSMIRKNNFSTRGLPPMRWGKIYRKETLLSVLDYCDERVSFGEDLLTTFAVMSKVNRIVSIDCVPYHYRIDNQSMTRGYSEIKYEKLDKLKFAMEKVANELYDYDFHEQLVGDYIALVLEQLEQEILFSKKKFGKLKRDLKSRVKRELFVKACSEIDFSKLRKKHKLYLFLISHNLFSIMIFIRKLKKVKKKG